VTKSISKIKNKENKLVAYLHA